MAEEEDREAEERGEETGGGKESKKWRWRGEEGVYHYEAHLAVWLVKRRNVGRVAGERVKNKWTNHKGRQKGEMLCSGRRNEAIWIWDLVMNSGTWSQGSHNDELRPPNIGHTASHHVNCVSETERCCACHWGECTLACRRCVWYVTSLGAAMLFTSALEEFRAFLNCRYKNSHYFWMSPLWECIPDPYTIHRRSSESLRVSVFWGKLLASWNHKNSLFNSNYVFIVSSHIKQTLQNMLKVRLINKPIMVSIGRNCVKTQCTNNINVPQQSKHRYDKSRAVQLGNTQGSHNTSFSLQDMVQRGLTKRAARSPHA